MKKSICSAGRLCALIVSFICLHIVVVAQASPLTEHKRIYILKTLELEIIDTAIATYQQQLQVLTPHYRYEFVIENANSDLTRAESLLANALASDKPYDLLVSIATVATKVLVASASSHDIPMQFMFVSDPVKVGVVDALNSTSQFNMTGISHVINTETKIGMLNDIIASSQLTKPLKIGLLFSQYPSTFNAAQELLALHDQYPQFEFIPVQYDYATGANQRDINRQRIITALNAVKDEYDSYWIPTGPAAYDLDLYAMIQAQVGKPQLFSEDIRHVEQGALFGVLSDGAIIGTSGAAKTVDIFNLGGANKCPVKRSDAFIVAINVASAVEQNLVIPSHILDLAKNHLFSVNSVSKIPITQPVTEAIKQPVKVTENENSQ